jgi:dephospho-CoA kinase
MANNWIEACMTLIIGLTGGIGSGKSTVSHYFSELKVEIVDADIVARQVVAKGQSVLRKIKSHFGKEVLINGELNRPFLREKIFEDDSQRIWLNSILHPLINKKIVHDLSLARGKYVLLEAPLLFENNLDALTDYNIVVDIDPVLQIERASARDGVSVENIKAIINKQISRTERIQKADFIIVNNDISMQSLECRVIDLDKLLRTL